VNSAGDLLSTGLFLLFEYPELVGRSPTVKRTMTIYFLHARPEASSWLAPVQLSVSSAGRSETGPASAYTANGAPGSCVQARRFVLCAQQVSAEIATASGLCSGLFSNLCSSRLVRKRVPFSLVWICSFCCPLCSRLRSSEKSQALWPAFYATPCLCISRAGEVAWSGWSLIVLCAMRLLRI
jgi:hypothetical protein